MLLLFLMLASLTTYSPLSMARALAFTSSLWHSIQKTNSYFSKLLHQQSNPSAITTATIGFIIPPKTIENFSKELRGSHAKSGIHEDDNIVLKEVPMNGTSDVLYSGNQRGIWTDFYNYCCLLQDCIYGKKVAEGKGLHAHMIKHVFEPDVFLSTKLVIFYAKCGNLEDARQLFDKMPERNSVSWNTLLAEYTRHGLEEEAIHLFGQMGEANMTPDEFSLGSVLKVCASLVTLELGKQVHAHVIRSGFRFNVVLMTALVDLYAKCKCMEDARRVFDETSLRDLVSWTAIIAGYVQQGNCKEALDLFCRMPWSGIKPNKVTFRTVLKACAGLGNLEQGKQIHAQMVINGFKLDLILGNGLTDMYAKCGSLHDARLVYKIMCERDVVSCNTMIAGYAQQGHGEEAMKLLSEMQMIGIQPDSFTFASAIGACASLASMEQGKQVHACIIRSGFVSDVVLGSTLVDMYAKCGSIEEARQVFDFIPQRDVVLWTVIVTAYGKHGFGKEVLQLFEEMKQSGLNPDDVTFLAVLTACSHSGLVNEGWHYFNSMTQDHCIAPRAGHYACMVDLLGRAGCLDEAHDFIKKMPFRPNVTVWGSLLGACQVHGNMELGKVAAEHLFELDPQNAGNYVVLSNVYATAGKWGDIIKLRKAMNDTGIKKEPGCSWIEIKSRVHVFPVGDRSHPQIQEIYAMLQKLAWQMKEAGYLPETNFILNDTEEQ